MKSIERRKSVTFLHLAAGIFLGAYIYSPLGEVAAFQMLVKFFILPLLALSGLWLWKGHLLQQSFKNKLTLLLLLSVGSINFAVAQESNAKDIEPKRWGGEFSVIGISVFNIYQGKMTYALNPKAPFKTELGLGFLIQPESTRPASESFNSDGLYSANQASVAVRQYFWKGLHFEQVVNFGNAGITNSKVDGNDYESFVVFSQTFLGYKLDLLKKDRFGLFVIGQAGFGSVPYSSDRWPTVEPSGFSIYPLGDLKVGINF